MLWKIKKIPVIYIVLVILSGALLVYFFQNYKVDDSSAQSKNADNQLSVMGASSIPFTAPQTNGAITADSQPQVAGPQSPTAKPTKTPIPTPTPTSAPTSTPEPTNSPTPQPTPTPSPTVTPTPSPTPTETPSPSPTATP